MDTDRKTAIIVGVLFITATVAPILSFPFTLHIDAPDYLISVSANATQVKIGSLFELTMAVAVAGIAIMMYPVFRKHNEGLALWYVGARILEGVLYTIGVILLLSLVTLSQEFVEAGAPDASYFQTLGTLLLAARDWGGHVLNDTIAFGLSTLIFYYLLYKSRLIPRWLSLWGLVGGPLWIAGGLLMMFGLIEPFSTSAVLSNLPIALNEMVLAVWLIVKGFNPSATKAV